MAQIFADIALKFIDRTTRGDAVGADRTPLDYNGLRLMLPTRTLAALWEFTMRQLIS